MGHFYFLLGLWVVVLLAFLVSLWRGLRRRLALPYRADNAMLSVSQRTFLEVLERAIGHGHRIFAKVHAIDVIGLRPKLSRRERELALRRLGDRRFDFLICDKETSAILCAVNLAPRSRLRKAPPRDALDRICAAARLPLVRFRERDDYSVVEVEERIFAAMKGPATHPRIGPASIDANALKANAIDPSRVDEQPQDSPKSPGVDAGRSEPKVVLRKPLSIRPDPGQPRRLKRRDPTLRDQDHQIVDDEPSFEIGDALDDHPPVRSRGG